MRGIKATGKTFKLSDGEQLYLHVSATGGRSWRMNYQFGRNAQGKLIQKTLTIGPYPAISLKDACEARDMAKSMLAKGIEPKPSDLFRNGELDPALRMTFEKMGANGPRCNQSAGRRYMPRMCLAALKRMSFPRLARGQSPTLPPPRSLGSGLVDHSQKSTVAARARAENKMVGQRS